MIFEENGDIYLRQSWLDTAFRCPERGRLAIVKPEWDSLSSDSAIIGTATHAAIETHMNLIGKADPTSDAWGQPLDALDEAIEAELERGVKWTKYATRADIHANAVRCYEAWLAGILPTILEMGLHHEALTEVNFRVPLYTRHCGRTIGMTGTADFVPKANVVWDWKTASQKFRPHEKQKYAIQGTIYTLAAVKGGLRSDVDYSYPMDFVYGVAVRGEAKATPQLLAVRRTEAHVDWAMHRIRALVDLALDYGLDRPWPTDDDHFLCSATWCPWWSICKGAHNVSDALPPGF